LDDGCNFSKTSFLKSSQLTKNENSSDGSGVMMVVAVVLVAVAATVAIVRSMYNIAMKHCNNTAMKKLF